jgi:hypothetical protein
LWHQGGSEHAKEEAHAYAGCYKAMEGIADLMAKSGASPTETRAVAGQMKKATLTLMEHYLTEFELEQVSGVGGIITARILHPMMNNKKKNAVPLVLECGAIFLKPDRARRAMQVLPGNF